MKFQPGDVVQLNSGGPWMTVRAIDQTIIGETRVQTLWFDDNAVLHGETFDAFCLINETDPIDRVVRAVCPSFP